MVDRLEFLSIQGEGEAVPDRPVFQGVNVLAILVVCFIILYG